jgi:O-antigen ligase
VVLAVMAVVALAAVDPFGWDHGGPIRWFAIPTLGLAAFSRRVPEVLSGATTASKLWAALLGWLGVAAAIGADPLYAWLGTPDRRFGWFTWLVCAAVALAAATVDERGRLTVARGVAVGSALMGVYTGLELVGVSAGPLGDLDFAGGRLGGPLGQPAFLGAAATLALPVSLGLAVDASSTGNGDADSAGSGRWRWAAAAGAAGALLALLGSQSRAAWLGVAVAAVCWLALGRWRPASASKVAALAAPVVVILAVPDLRARLTSAFGSGGVVDGRLDEWRVGLSALGSSPLTGYGPEGYRTVFGRHVDDGYVISWGRDVITDRAHAGWLDVALVGGLPALVLYGALLVLAGRAALNALRSGQAVPVGLAVAVVAYAVQQQFLFPLSELDPLFWCLAGLLMARSGAGSQAGEHTRPRAGAVVSGLAIGWAVLVAVAGLLNLAANRRLATALDQPTTDRSLEQLATASRLSPDSIRYRFVAARVAAADGRLSVAVDHIERGLDRSPHDPALLGEQASLLLAIARATAPGPDRDNRLAAAAANLEAVLVDDPRNPNHLQELGIALALQGDFTGARTQLERAVELAPDDRDAALNLAELERLEADAG